MTKPDELKLILWRILFTVLEIFTSKSAWALLVGAETTYQQTGDARVFLAAATAYAVKNMSTDFGTGKAKVESSRHENEHKAYTDG